MTGQEMHRFTGHTNVVAGVAFSPDSKYALTGSFDGTARLWDVATGREVRQFKGHTGNLIGDVAFSHNGTYVLTSGDDKTVRLWDAQTGQQLRQFTGDLQNDLGLAFSPDDKYVLSGNDDGIARLWRIDLQDVVRFACTTLPRDLSADERATYSITDNTPTCPKP